MTAREGWRLWLTALSASLLTTALLFAPRLAGEHDFGHWHPEGTPEHVHNLSALLGAAPELAAPVTGVAVLRLVFLLEPTRLLERSTPLPSHQQARAPPRED